MVKIRLKRIGRKKQPSYRVVVSDSRKDMFGSYLEAVGFYNPRSNPKDIRFNEDRVKYWISQGAQASSTVHNLLVEQGVVVGKKIKTTKGKVKPVEEVKIKVEEKVVEGDLSKKDEVSKENDVKKNENEAVSEKKIESN